MADSSPIVERVKEGDPEYYFYLYTLTMFSKLMFPEGYDARFISPERLQRYVNVDFQSHNRLLSKFTLPSNQTSSIDISFNEVMFLLFATDMISNALLGDNADSFESIIAESLAVSDKSWFIEYLKSAQILFSNYRKRFQNYKQIIELLDKIGNAPKQL